MRQRSLLLTIVLSCSFLHTNLAKAQTAAAPGPSSTAGGEMLGMGGGNVYVAKSVNGLANFKVVYKKSTLNGAETAVGTVQKGHYVISTPADAAAFEAATGLHAVTQQELASGILSTPVNGSAPGQLAQPSQPQVSAPSDGTTADLGDGTLRVTFTSGRYSGDTVDFTRGGNDILIKTGEVIKGEAKFGGGNHSVVQTTGHVLQGLGSTAWHSASSAVIDPGNNWDVIPYYKGRPGASVNTEHAGAGKMSGTTGFDPEGLAAETLAANEILVKTKPDFVLPKANRLRDLAEYQVPSAPK